MKTERRQRTNGQNRARLLGTLHGKRVYRFPVEVTFGETAALRQINYYPKGVVSIIAHSATEAADFVSEPFLATPCVEVAVFGVKGGLAARRYWGFERAIFFGMERSQETQLELFRGAA